MTAKDDKLIGQLYKRLNKLRASGHKGSKEYAKVFKQLRSIQEKEAKKMRIAFNRDISVISSKIKDLLSEADNLMKHVTKRSIKVDYTINVICPACLGKGAARGQKMTPENDDWKEWVPCPCEYCRDTGRVIATTSPN